MIGKRRRERRRQARAAIERYEEQLRAAKARSEGDVIERDRALAEARHYRAHSNAVDQRLDDANAELARWGLEPIPRDVPESPDQPTRYRRHSDWRTTRSGDELTELLERSVECSPPNVEVEISQPPGYLAFEEFGAPAITGAYLREAVDATLADHAERIEQAAKAPRPLQSNADLVAQVRSVLQDTRDALRDRELNPRGLISRTRELLERLERDPMAIVSGDVHLGLASALAGAMRDLHAMRVERNEALRSEAECQDALAVAREDTRRAELRDTDARGEVERLRERIGQAHAAGWLEGADTMSTGEEGLGLAAPWPERAAALRRQRDEAFAARDGLRESVELAKAQTVEARAEVTRLQGDLAIARADADAGGDAAIADLTRELDEKTTAHADQRTEAERLQRVNDVLTGELDQTRLELERVQAAIGTAPALEVGQLVRVSVTPATLPPVWVRVATVEPGEPGPIVTFEREQ